ncbi:MULTISPECIES: STM4012 family radical SAM protein [Streptomyces]|uniref:STM4012 family radical SAM protein n=1 Tax=Streptomyces TaxID=1883 RepID=UPI000F7A34D0|nr:MULTISPECIES: STM4012 family radical SAM protein [Streptomyces]RST05121.1 coproporphyrinogen III oxidase family protein [Streptomyces sp. WAC07149]GLX16498.1 coproporphyrinogen III oxidase [Streptomyces lavendulae subsp. lavendulae]GLX25118.1 coproporphyrinogen III oxidase [Streptomyces lavendulae subsp. lavendulae]
MNAPVLLPTPSFPAPSADADPETPYEQYVYAYPHQKAYRLLEDGPLLSDLWSRERLDALSLYAHIPFCEMRCGFCNLFTRTGAPEEVTGAFLATLERQARVTREALEAKGEPIRFTLAAFGGGTPTYLTADELTRLCDISENIMGADLKAASWSVETSPATATADRIAVLAERGATRLSIGVQSFVDEEARAAVRPQKRAEVEASLARLKEAKFPILNIDLIYGIDGQTERTFRVSLDAALAWEPEEIYLYPLYVRPLTGLSTRHAKTLQDWNDQRLRLYRYGRDHLLSAGYEQTSMRVFRRTGTAAVEDTDGSSISEYNQQAGMVGLGVGARSFTTDLHYTTDYAVAVPEVRRIIDDYIATPTERFRHAQWAFRMDDAERRRMYVLQHLLESTGMRTATYEQRFTTRFEDDFGPQLDFLLKRNWLRDSGGTLGLTPDGMAWADAIGPMFFSDRVRTNMTAYQDR